MDSKQQKIAIAAASATASFALLYWLVSPRAPLLTPADKEKHLYHLDHITDLPKPEGYDDWKPPHRVRLSKKELEKANDVDVIIIGSGLGALTTGSLMAQRGYKVLLLEQHDQAGGCLHTFSEKNFEFDVGLHYIGGDVGNRFSPVRKLYDAVSGGIVDWCKLDDPYDLAVCTGKKGTDPAETVPYYGDYSKTMQGLMSRLDPSEHRGVRKYFRAMDTGMLGMGGWLLSKTLSPFLRSILHPLLMLPARGTLNKTTKEVFERCGLKSTKAYGMLTYLYGDYGLNPGQSAWGVHAAVMNHWKGGAYYPYGGSSTLAMGACEVIRRKGGQVLVNAKVKKIVVENNRAVGVELERGQVIKAKMVVSDAGFRNTCERLLTREQAEYATTKDFVQALQTGGEDACVVGGGIPGGLGPSCTLLNLFVGFDKSCEELDIPATNRWITPSWDMDKNAEEFIAGDGEGEMPIVFIGSNSAKDASYKMRYGPDRGSIMVLAPVNYAWFKKWEETRVHARGDDAYNELKQFWTDKLFAALYEQYPQIKDHVVFSDLGTPLSNNHYLGVKHGEVYGLAHTTDRTWKYSKELSAKTNIKGLYMTGQDLMSAGVTAALFAGVITVGAISPATLVSHTHNLI